MKKMKKFVTTLVCLVVAIATLSACTASTGNNKPTTEPSEKPTEVVTTEPTVTEEPTTEPTTETTTTVEPSATQASDSVIYLYDYVFTDTIKQMSPESVVSDFYNTLAPYMPLSTVSEESGMTVYRFTIDGVPQASFTLGNTGNDSTEVEVYLCISTAGVSTTSFSTSTGASDTIDFIPLFYNATKKCLVGYSGYNTNNPGFREVYWSAVGECTVPVDVDPSLYGF